MFSGIRAPAWHGGFRTSRLFLTRVWRNYLQSVRCDERMTLQISSCHLDLKEETLSEDYLDGPPKTDLIDLEERAP